MYSEIFRTFTDGKSIGFGRGKIDDYCVFIKDNDGFRAPLDTEYFQFIYDLATEYGTLSVYDSFKKLYLIAEKKLHPKANEIIDMASARFPERYLQSQLYFSVLYMAMVAEQNYPSTKLGKRLKRLGIYQLLFEEMSVQEAANWSRGKPWRVISVECEKRGF
ncbi:hypothetical protein N9O16_00355 [Candidatus Poseidoniaceae archaeon]|nr:hypothetical protein [Candidatus Poseidoniaceae archaeon]